MSMEESYIHVNSQDKRMLFVLHSMKLEGQSYLRPLELSWVPYESQMLHKYRILCFLCCILPLILYCYALILLFGK